MKTKINFLLVLLITSLSIFSNLYASENKAFYFDAVVFDSDRDSLLRLDVYTIIPWESLEFIKTQNLFGAKYLQLITIANSEGKIISDKSISKTVRTEDYFKSQGSNADYENSQAIFYLPAGNYKVTVIIKDEISNMEFKRARSIEALDFDKFPYSMSGILLLSSIEETGGKYTITPHASDNVGGLDDGYFAFFEIYNDTTITESDFVYQIMQKNGKVLYESKRIRKPVNKKINRLYIKIAPPEGSFGEDLVLRIISLAPIDSNEYTENDFLAVSQRTVRYEKTLSGIVLTDINKAIRQLRYVADGSEMDHIQDGQTDAVRLKRFEEFWEDRDPTPSTERNEAFEEFYTRVEFANNNFKSYTEGWLTDKGHVYIVFGHPHNIERYQRNLGDNRAIEVWTYLNNYEFYFQDKDGFGDFRLYRPLSVTEKYKYRN